MPWKSTNKFSLSYRVKNTKNIQHQKRKTQILLIKTVTFCHLELLPGINSTSCIGWKTGNSNLKTDKRTKTETACNENMHMHTCTHARAHTHTQKCLNWCIFDKMKSKSFRQTINKVPQNPHKRCSIHSSGQMTLMKECHRIWQAEASGWLFFVNRYCLHSKFCQRQ